MNRKKGNPEVDEKEIQGETGPPPGRSGTWRMIRIALLLMAVLLASLVAYVQSESFSQSLRGRIISELESRLGARATIEEFSFSWLSLTAHLGGLSIEGRPSGHATPTSNSAFLAVRSIDASWSLLSIFPLRADFDSLQLVEPVMYVEFYPDGTNNLPVPPASAPQAGDWAERLIGLRIGRLDVVDGEMVWDERRVPLTFQAEQLGLTMEYANPEAVGGQSAAPSYAGTLSFENARFKRAGAGPDMLRASVKFTLHSGGAEFSEIKLASGKSALDATVAVNSLRNLDLATTFDARLDWSEAGPWMGMRGWQGDIHWTGAGTITAETMNLSGALELNSSRTGLPNWEHVPWKLASELTLTRRQGGTSSPETSAALAGLRIEALGGELVGQADVVAAAADLRVHAQLQASRMQFAEVASALRAIPVDLLRLPWATEFSGPVEVIYTRPQTRSAAQPGGPANGLLVTVDMTALPPVEVAPGLMPVSGNVKAQYIAGSRRLENVQANFDLPGANLRAQGFMQESESRMQLALDATRLEAIRPAAELFWNGFSTLPIKLDGNIHAESTWTGGWREAVFDGPARLSGFSYGEDRWDALSGHVRAHRRVSEADSVANGQPTRRTQTELTIANGILRSGQGAAEFDLRISLRDGRFQPDNRFEASGNLRQIDVADIKRWMAAELPLAGNVDGEFRASGTRGAPRGTASLAIAGGTLYGERFNQLAAEIQFEPGPVIQLKPVRLTRDGVLRGSATVWPNERRVEMDLTAERISLNQSPQLRDLKFPINGVLSGHLIGKGTYDALVANGDFSVSDAGAGPVRDGQLHGEYTVNGRRLQWTAKGSLFGADVAGGGEVSILQPYPLTASINLRNGNLSNFATFAPGFPEGLEGAIDAHARISGNAADGRSIAASGEISRLEVARLGVAMRIDRPVPLNYQYQLLRMDGLRLVGDQVDIAASGTIRTTTDPALNLRATGTIDLASLSKLDPQVATQGRADLDAQITGTFRRPLWRGRLSVQNASAQFGRLANSLSAIRGTIVFDGTRGDLEDFRAESGGGEVLIGGALRYGEGSGLQFNLNGTVRNVRIRYPEALSTWIDGQLNWTGSARSSLLEGRITINRHSIAPPNDLAQVLFSRRRSAAQPVNSPFLQNMRLNLNVMSAPEVRLDTRTARNLQTAFDARIQGTGAQPAVLGRIGILSGEVDFAGKRYTINRGEVTFLNPFRFEPELNLNVQARVQQYDLTMDFAGPPDRLNVTYRSDPPLPTRDILALLVAGGVRQTSLQPSAQPLPQVTADSLLSQALSNQIGSRLDRIFGSGRVRVDPQLNTLSGTASATIALEQQIRNNITLLYATDVSSAQQQYVQGEWIISPKLSVVGIRDQNGLVGVNFQITLRFE